MMDLKLEGIIDDNYQPTEDYEEPEDYQEIMEMNQGDTLEQDDVDEEPDQDNEDVEKSEDEDPGSEDTEYEEVRITSKVPEFKGTDLSDYGPFSEGEVVEVPEDNAEILVNRGNAEQVEEEDSEPAEEDDEQEPPGEEWLCTCGALNEGDRTVCRKCTKSYEEVEEETERS